MAVAMTVLDARIETVRPDGTARTIPITSFYRLPCSTPHLETVLEAGEMIAAVLLPPPLPGRHFPEQQSAPVEHVAPAGLQQSGSLLQPTTTQQPSERPHPGGVLTQLPLVALQSSAVHESPSSQSPALEQVTPDRDTTASTSPQP